MADPRPLLLNSEQTQLRLPRVASVDVFRGLSVFVTFSLFPVNVSLFLFDYYYYYVAAYDFRRLWWIHLPRNSSCSVEWNSPRWFSYAFFSLSRWNFTRTCLQGTSSLHPHLLLLLLQFCIFIYQLGLINLLTFFFYQKKCQRRPQRRTQATWKAFVRSLQLFILGILLQGQ